MSSQSSLNNLQATDLFKQLATKAGFTPEQVDLALKADEFKEFENGYRRQSEYSQALDRAKALEPQAAKAAEWDEWWSKKGGKKVYETYQESQATLARYQERFGDLNPNSQADVREAAATTGMTIQQVQALLNDQGTRWSQMLADRDLVFADAATRGLKFSTEDLATMNRLQAEKGVTFSAAYETHMGPRVREMDQKARETEKEAYAAEKVRDALSRVGHNGLPPTADVPNFYDRPKAGVAEKSMNDQELLAMWNDSAPKAA